MLLAAQAEAARAKKEAAIAKEETAQLKAETRAVAEVVKQKLKTSAFAKMKEETVNADAAGYFVCCECFHNESRLRKGFPATKGSLGCK